MKPWGSGLPDPLPAGLRRMLPYLSGSPWPEIYPGAPASTQHYTLPGESSGDRWAVLVACRAGTSGEEDGEGGDLPVRMRQERCPNCCLAGGAAWAVLPGSRRCRRCSALCGPLGSKGGSWAVEWRGCLAQGAQRSAIEMWLWMFRGHGQEIRQRAIILPVAPIGSGADRISVFTDRASTRVQKKSLKIMGKI